MICNFCQIEFKCCEYENVKPKYKSCMMRSKGYPQSKLSFKNHILLHICSKKCDDLYNASEHSMDYQNAKRNLIKLEGPDGWSTTYDPTITSEAEAMRGLLEMINENMLF